MLFLFSDYISIVDISYGCNIGQLALDNNNHRPTWCMDTSKPLSDESCVENLYWKTQFSISGRYYFRADSRLESALCLIRMCVWEVISIWHYSVHKVTLTFDWYYLWVICCNQLSQLEHIFYMKALRKGLLEKWIQLYSYATSLLF